MVGLHPFRALRYNPDLVSALTPVIAPPYDVIGPQEQDQLYASSPYNIIRLTLGKQSAADTEQDNRYTRARRDFDAWRRARILIEDATPAVYPIDHVFSDGRSTQSRLGFIGLLELTEQTPQSIHRHEATLAAPKADRTKLLKAVPAHLEPIFCIYPDEGGAIQAALRAITQRAIPTAQAAWQGNTVRLWAVSDAQVIETLRRHLSHAALLIADGHHRFEVAYAHRQRVTTLMSYFVSMADPALVVRPIHRVQEAPLSLQQLGALATLTPTATLDEALAALEQGCGQQGRFGYFDGHAFYDVTVRPERLAEWLRQPSVPQAIAMLDVSILPGMLLPPGTPLHYTADATQAVRDVREGRGHSAWLLRGIPLLQVYSLASQDQLLPPKSTYFYPKVPSGLTMQALADGPRAH